MCKEAIKDFIEHFGCFGTGCIVGAAIGILMVLVGIIGKVIQLL